MSPLAEYRARLEQRRLASGRFEKQFRRIGNARLAAGLAAAVVAFFVFGEVWIRQGNDWKALYEQETYVQPSPAK